MLDYQQFLRSKRTYAKPCGFDPDPSALPSILKPFQRDVVSYLLRIGRGAAFEECGLGKTAQSLSWAAAVTQHTGKPALMLCPLAVAGQTKREAVKFNIGNGNLPIEIVGSSDAIEHRNSPGIYITNYDKLIPVKNKPSRFDTSIFSGVWLDESSILKGYNSKIKQSICSDFRDTPFRGAGTATPSPNDLLELGNHSEFLGAMPSSEMIARWFINDLAHTGKYRLKHHAEKDYWEWVASWAVSLSTPADLGYSDEGYVLPPLNIEERVVEVDEGPPLSGQLFANTPLNATTIFQEKRNSLASRVDEVASIVNASTAPWVVWCDLNDESKELARKIPDAIEVTGSMHDHIKETLIDRFSTGQARVIISKPSICGFGVNWQHCSNAAFVGVSYSFEAFYQAVRRLWRFGQINPVRCVVVNSPAEQQIWRTVCRKETAHLELQSKMSGAMKRAQMELVRGIREVEKYNAEESMKIPAWLGGKA